MTHFDFDRTHMTSYWRSIVTMALSGVVSETKCNICAHSQFSPTPPLFDAPWERTTSNFVVIFCAENYTDGVTRGSKRFKVGLAVHAQYRRVTDRQTDAHHTTA